MFNKKIIASALIGSLAFSLFPTNIFANNSLSEAERKICENKDDILYFDVNGNDLFTLFNDKNAKNLNFEEIQKLKPSYMTKNGKKIGENYLSDLVTMGAEAWFPSINFYDYNSGEYEYIKNGKKLDFNFNIDGKIMINEKGDFIYQGRDFKYYKNGVKINFPEDINIYTNKYGNLIYEDFSNNKVYSNNIELNIPENAKVLYETIQDGNYIYELNGKYYNKNNIELKVGSEIEKIPGGLSAHYTLNQNHILNGDDLYIQAVDENNKSFKIYKNGKIIFENSVNKDEYYIYNSDNIIKINNNGEIYSFFTNGNEGGIIFKNGKPLCENLENNSGNTGNTNNGNTTTVSGGSPVSNPEDLKLKDDPRVLDQNNSSNTTKTEETKKEEIDKKIEELNGILENYNELMPYVIGHENSFEHYNWDLDGKSKHYISFKIQNILEKNSYNIIRNIYKNSSKEKIKKLASENNFISYYLEEYKKQFEELELKIDSYTYNLPIEVIKKIKTRIKTFFEKYDNLDYLVRIYKVLKSDPKIQKQAETSKEVYYIINIYNVNLVYDIINEDIQKNYDINLDIEEIRKKQEENFQKYKANLKN